MKTAIYIPCLHCEGKGRFELEAWTVRLSTNEDGLRVPTAFGRPPIEESLVYSTGVDGGQRRWYAVHPRRVYDSAEEAIAATDLFFEDHPEVLQAQGRILCCDECSDVVGYSGEHSSAMRYCPTCKKLKSVSELLLADANRSPS